MVQIISYSDVNVPMGAKGGKTQITNVGSAENGPPPFLMRRQLKYELAISFSTQQQNKIIFLENLNRPLFSTVQNHFSKKECKTRQIN